MATRESWNGTLPSSSLFPWKRGVYWGVLSTLTSSWLLPGAADALPSGESVRAGNVSFERSGKTMTIRSGSSRSIVNYQGFDIDADEMVNIELPSAVSSILNRVTGGNPSQILGKLNSNGQVFLVNPSGIVFGAQSQVNVGSLVASTLNISDSDFLAGQMRFSKDPSAPPGKIVNHGAITTAQGGTVVLAGGAVENTGMISAPGGSIHVAVGDQVQVTMGDGVEVKVQVDENLKQKVDGVQSAIQNTGVLSVNGGGTVSLQAQLEQGLYERAVNNAGRIEAHNYIFQDDGTIVFETNGTVVNTGQLVSQGQGIGAPGGHIEISGQEVFHWVSPEGSPSSAIDVQGLTPGSSGGTIAIESSQMTRIDGDLLASGSLNGGQVTIESGSNLDLSGAMVAEGIEGAGGQVRLTSTQPMMAMGSHRISVNGGAHGGQIQLDAPGLFSSGTYTATSSQGVGGTIEMGGNLSLLGATVDASGAQGGGVLRLGGEFQGGQGLGQDEVRNAQNTIISQGTVLKAASMGDHGDGGTVIVWSDDTTHFYGEIDARPGLLSGAGGFVEVSGKETLNLLSNQIQTGRGDRLGSILLDPRNIYIQETPLQGLNLVKMALGNVSTSVSNSLNLANSDFFGISTALNDSGSVWAVAAYNDDTGGVDRGAVYLFNLNTSNLNAPPVLRQKIAYGIPGMNLNDFSSLGRGMALNSSGSMIAIGAIGDSTGGTNRGAVYILSLNPNNLSQTAVFEQKIAHGTAGIVLNDSDFFGRSVALSGSGSILAVGADNDDTGGVDRGAVYVFGLTPNQLSSTATFGQKITHGTSGLVLADSNLFASGVALNNTGNLLAVSTFLDDTGGPNRGAVYLLGLNANNLAQAPTVYQKINHGVSGLALADSDRFGRSIALNEEGSILAVGADGDDTGGPDRGAVYVLGLNSNNWSQAPTYGQKITSALGGLSVNDDDRFGFSVALNGTGSILGVGAYQDDTGGANRGASYLLGLNPSNLAQVPTVYHKITHGFPQLSLVDSDSFGNATALTDQGTLLAVGAAGDNTGGNDRGAVYLFSVNPNSLSSPVSLLQKIAHGTAGIALADSDQFGRSVSLNEGGSILAVGAHGDDTGGSNRGSVYLLGLNPNNWGQAPTFGQKIAHGTSGLNLANTDFFGFSVSLNDTGNVLAVGTTGNDTGGTDRGGVYLFGINPSNLSQAPSLGQLIAHGTSGLALSDGDVLGGSVVLSGAGNILAIGAYGDDTGGSNRGAAYLLGIDPNNLSSAPSYGQKIAHGTVGLNFADNDFFGRSVALNDTGNILAIGSWNDDTGGADRGAVYLFGLNSSNLSQVPTFSQKIAHGTSGLNLANTDGFGIALSLNDSGNILSVGSSGDDTGGTSRGAVYLFGLNPNNLSQLPTLNQKIAHGSLGLTVNGGDNFGYGLAFNDSGSILGVGAPNDDTGGASRGAVYLFNVNLNDLTTVPTFGTKIAHGTPGVSLADGDNFGLNLDFNDAGNILAIASQGDDTGGADRGAAYLFNVDVNSSNLTPTFRYKLASGSPGFTVNNGDLFGRSVALNGTGNILAVGSPLDDTTAFNTGSAYLFNLNPNDLTQAPVFRYKILSGLPGFTLGFGDNFGSAIALNSQGDRLAVTASVSDIGGADRGAVFLFNLNSSDLTQAPVYQNTLAHGVSGLSLANSDQFGSGVSLSSDGKLLAVGAFFDDTGGSDRGAAYLFQLNGVDNTQAPVLQRKITHNTLGLNLNNSDWMGTSVALNGRGTLLALGAPNDDSSGFTDGGAVYLMNLGQSHYGQSNGQDLQLSPGFIRALLSTGNQLTLQASNDIVVRDPILVNNPWGNGGALTLQAGRNIYIYGGITTDNGNLTLIANDLLSNGVFNSDRLAGSANIYSEFGTLLNAGTGDVTMELRNGAGKTYASAGEVTLRSVQGDDLLVRSQGNITLAPGGVLTAQGDGDIVLSAENGGNFANNSGPNALVVGTGRRLVYSNRPSETNTGGITFSTTRYGKTYGTLPPISLGSTGDYLIFAQGLSVPTVTLSTGEPLVLSNAVDTAMTAQNQTFLLNTVQYPWTNGEDSAVSGALPLRSPIQPAHEVTRPEPLNIQLENPFVKPPVSLPLEMLESNPDLWRFIRASETVSLSPDPSEEE